MKIDRYLIFGAIILIAIVAAVSAHLTSIAEKDAEIEAIQQAAARRETAISAELADALAALQPKPYHQPTDHLWISSDTGYRTDPLGGSEYERLHKGIDIAGEIGDPVYAALDGEVMEHWLPPDGGIWKGHPALGGMITLQHDGFFTIYGHLSESYVHEGDMIQAGQLIGRIGNTGISTGPHLHWEIVVEPLQYLAER